MKDLRSLPSVDYLLNSEIGQQSIAEYGRPLTLEAIRNALDVARKNYQQNMGIPTEGEIWEKVNEELEDWTNPTLVPVINASGVILHTNLGRAPLSDAAMRAADEVARGYSSLEYDLERGRRGSRLVHAESLLCRITQAEAAMVVNNNAAAVMLILSALARRRKVVIARSQLVEIGGGFRIPDVMKQSGAKLLEVGTTNRIHLYDYEAALAEKPALIMRAHRSNFRILGFTSEPNLDEIVAVAHQAGLPLVDDLGSGSLLDTTRYGLGHEPMVQESLAAGADLVCFSGDKLLGGPQAGVIIGRKKLITKLKKHPLARAIRADKLCLSAMNATLLHYLKDEAEQKIPIWRMIATPIDEIQSRAQNWTRILGQGNVIEGRSTVGGGSLPGETLPTALFALSLRNPNRYLSSLRHLNPPIIARMEKDMVVLDPRTVLPEQDQTLLAGLQQTLSKK
jgi:L-seryl-tRNA(Ser) seleniumtransferase